MTCTCGAPWRSWGSYNGPKGSRWYGCSQRDRGPAELCDYSGPRKAFEAGWLDEVLWTHLMSMMRPQDVEARFADEGGRPDVADELGAARAASDRLEAELSRLYRMAARSDEGAMASALREAEEDLAAARREETRLASLQADSLVAAEAMGKARSALDRIWSTEDPEEMARVLGDLRVRVQLRQPEGDDVLSYVLTAELMTEEPFVVGIGATDFEKEMAELESPEQQAL